MCIFRSELNKQPERDIKIPYIYIYIYKKDVYILYPKSGFAQASALTLGFNSLNWVKPWQKWVKPARYKVSIIFC